MLKILQARLHHYMNCELPDVQAGFRKGKGTRDQIANICWIIKKAREFQKKHLFLLYWLCQSLWLCGPQQTGKFWKRWECQIMKLKYVKMSIISGTQNIYLTWVFVIYYIYRFSFEYLLGIPDRLTCLLRNLYAGKEAAVRTGRGTKDWFQIGKGIC